MLRRRVRSTERAELAAEAAMDAELELARAAQGRRLFRQHES
jgi:hypothetical protein